MRRWPSSTRVFRRFTRISGAVDSAGAIAARCAVAASLFDPLGAAIGRTAGVRHAVSLVRRAVDRRGGVRRLELLEEPRPLAHARSRARVSVFAPRPGGGKAASEHRAFFGRWNDVEGLGVEEELPSQEPALGRRPGERPGRSASARAQRRSRLPQDQALEASATPSASGCASASRKDSAGRRRSAVSSR